MIGGKMTRPATKSKPSQAATGADVLPDQPRGSTFREVCCHRLGIPLTAFEKQVLLECLPRAYRLPGRIRWQVNRAYFKPDLALIRAVADCTKVNQIVSKVNYLHKTVLQRPRFGRSVLRFRLSGRRLICLARQFLP